MTITRRDLLLGGASAAALLLVPRPLQAKFGARAEPLPPITDPRVRDLAFRAVEAARAAGATYADVRLTHTRARNIAPFMGRGSIEDREDMCVGVRALRNGYWGFASSAVWSADEMARLGTEAVHQSNSNALGKAREFDLAAIPAVAAGHWATPVSRDAFMTDVDEIVDLLYSLDLFVERSNSKRSDDELRVSADENHANFEKQDKAFASSEGSYCTQELHRSEGLFAVVHSKSHYKLVLDSLTPASLGWELYTGQPLREAILRLIDELLEDLSLPVKPIEVGRYDTVFDAFSTAQLLDKTLARATELDRALGFEANASGTSFIDDPLAMVGSLQIASPLVTISAERTAPGSAATVAWDDDGVCPGAFTLVDKGRLVDFQTTRESAASLGDYYRKHGQDVRSHGCAQAPSGVEAPLTRAPNLSLAPGANTLDFDSLVGQLTKGIAVKSLYPEMDYQNLNGVGSGRIYEVRNGKRVARVAGAALFRAPELWKACAAVGSPKSARRYGMTTSKGQPPQNAHHSVSASPARFTQVTFVDPYRKA